MLNRSENEFSKFVTKNRKVINSESNGSYLHHDPTKFLTKLIESSPCDYCDAYMLVTGNVAVTRTIPAAGDNPIRRNQPLATATQVAFKNCAAIKDCRTEINDSFVDETDFINIAMPMYNLIEHIDSYSDISGSLWGFKRDEVVNNADVTNENDASSFRYIAGLINNTEADGKKMG